jgi:hypothetical protein
VIVTYYYEVRPTVSRIGKLRFVPADELHLHTGFRSVYGYDEALVDLLLDRGSTEAMAGYPVFANELIVDVDDDDLVPQVAEQLKKLGVSFQWFNTGRRGAHFHVATEPLCVRNLPHSMRMWCKSNMPEGVDLTIYREAAVIRLPGTWHEKNPGHRKELVHSASGNLLVIPVVAPPPPPSGTWDRTEGPRPKAEFWALYLETKAEPGRHMRLFALGARAAECGMSYEEGLDAVTEWAATKAIPPIPGHDVAQHYANGYRRVKSSA